MKAISLDNLKRFYNKCKQLFASKQLEDEVADTLHAINGDGVVIDKALVVQESGDAEDRVMSQKAVTEAIAGAGGGEWTQVANITLTENVGSVMQEVGAAKEVLIWLAGNLFTNGTDNKADQIMMAVNSPTIIAYDTILGGSATALSRDYIITLSTVSGRVVSEVCAGIYTTGYVPKQITYNGRLQGISEFNTIILSPQTSTNFFKAGVTIKIYTK